MGGRGSATWPRASGLIELRIVIAHTMPAWNASSRVLEKAGFRFDREAMKG